MEAKTCIFCEKIIIPKNLIYSYEIKKYFEEKIKVPFTIKYSTNGLTLGNKCICIECLNKLKKSLISEDEDCSGNCAGCSECSK